MTLKELPTTIQATIHQDALERVPSFFNASLKDTLNELLQNARRSGATLVQITQEKNTITVSDNGRGIEDPNTILAFGHSDWDNQTKESEHPAGMGLYSLARREGVRIRSKTEDGVPWAVRLNPKNFTGEEPAFVDRMFSRINTGTTVIFQTTKEPHRSTITEATRFFPLPVTVNGDPVPQQDFLKNAKYIEDWHGVRIGAHPHGNFKNFNFHGVLIDQCDFATVRTMDTPWHATIDINDCPELQLTLPARKEIVRTTFLENLQKACLRAIYRALKANSIDVPRTEQQAARELGVFIPDPQPKLRAWHSPPADWTAHDRTEFQELPENPIIVTADMQTTESQSLEWALNDHPLAQRLYRSDNRLKGYPWFEAIAVLDSVEFVTIQDGQEKNLQELYDDSYNELKTADTIQAKLNITHQDGSTESITVETDLFLPYHEEEHIDDADVVHVPNHNINVHLLADLLHDTYFSPSDSSESDSYDTQEHFHRQLAQKTAAKAIFDPNQATAHNMAQAADDHVSYMLPEGKTAVITVRRGHTTTVTITDTPEEDGDSSDQE